MRENTDQTNSGYGHFSRSVLCYNNEATLCSLLIVFTVQFICIQVKITERKRLQRFVNSHPREKICSWFEEHNTQKSIFQNFSTDFATQRIFQANLRDSVANIWKMVYCAVKSFPMKVENRKNGTINFVVYIFLRYVFV